MLAQRSYNQTNGRYKLTKQSAVFPGLALLIPLSCHCRYTELGSWETMLYEKGYKRMETN